MNRDLLNAQKVLKQKDATCVFCKDDDVIVSKMRGVKPLIDFIESGNDYSGYSVADKVVGNGAAYLYVILNIKEIFANVISEPACETFKKYGIGYTYQSKVKSIHNRTNTGMCPMEQAVINAQTPDEAFLCVKRKTEELKTVK